MDVFAPLAVLISLIYAVGNLIKQAQGGDTKNALTQVAIWVIGVLLTLLVGASDVGSSVVLGEWVLGEIDVLSQILFGLGLASTANVLYDALPKNTPTLGVKSSANS